MAKPGRPKPPNSGRKKGSRNKKTAAVKEFLEDMGFNPVERLANFARGDHVALDLEYAIPLDIQIRCLIELLKYVHPQLKSIEGNITTTIDDERPLEHLSDEELDNL